MKLTEELKNQLEEKIIPYWKALRDDVNGGYYGYVDFDLNVQKDAVKGCILNSRIMWFFSSAYLTLGREDLLDEANHAYEFLKNACLDKKNGGVFWSLTYDGKVEDSTKHTYNQAFAIYALSAYYEASKNEEALKIALDLFDKIETTCVDQYGYLEAFTEDWKLVDNDKLSENGLLADKTMNTLLHLLEAYTALLDVYKSDKVKEKLVEILHVFKTKVYNPEKKQLEVFFDEKLNTISDLYSYGHDIEATWLLDRACEVVGDDKITAETHEMTNVLAEAVYNNAIVGNSLNNECFHGVVDTTRVWWVQAEAIVGYYNAYQKTNNKKYLDMAENIWEYIKEHFIDKRDGSEWFWDLNKDGVPESKKPITEPWKCPYHNGRMCMEIIRRTK